MDPPFGLAVLCGNLVATCEQDRRLWIWIYPWISTQKSVDMDMDMDGKFHIHGKPVEMSTIDRNARWVVALNMRITLSELEING